MTIDNLITEIQDYFGPYDSTILAHVKGYLLKEYKDTQYDALLRWVKISRPQKFGPPDINAFWEAWKLRNQHRTMVYPKDENLTVEEERERIEKQIEELRNQANGG